MEVVIQTAPHDPRFPSTNQARHCYTRFNEFYRCGPQVWDSSSIRRVLF